MHGSPSLRAARGRTGLSDEAPNRKRTIDDLCDVQGEVRGKLNLRAPVVLAGQSGGANLVIWCASRRPAAVAALVSIEGYHDDPAELAAGGFHWRDNPEHMDYVESSEMLDKMSRPIGKFPVLVVTATEAGQRGIKNQKYWLALSTKSRQVVLQGATTCTRKSPTKSSPRSSRHCPTARASMRPVCAAAQKKDAAFPRPRCTGRKPASRHRRVATPQASRFAKRHRGAPRRPSRVDAAHSETVTRCQRARKPPAQTQPPGTPAIPTLACMTYTYQQLREVSDDELIAIHDEIATNTFGGVDFYLDELRRRDNARATASNYKLARAAFWLTVANSVLSAVALLSAFLR